MIDLFSFLQENKIQLYSILGSVGLFLFIIRLIKKRKLKEEHSILWLSVFFVFILLSIFRSFLELLADFAGIHYAPAALLLFLILGVLIILIRYSIIISKLTEENKNLIQEMALLKNEIETNK